MKYLNLQITTLSHELVYAKDVEASHLFEGFIRKLVAGLVMQNVIQQGEHYTVTVIPRYGQFLQRAATVLLEDHPPELPTWITLRYDEPPPADHPAVRYFSFEIRVRERKLLIRADFQMHEVTQDFIALGIEQVLISLGVLSAGQHYRIVFTAREDNTPNFEREHIPALQKKAADLIEFLSDESEVPTFPLRAADHYPTASLQGMGPPARDDLQVYIHRRTLEKLHQAAQKSTEVELGGLLVGNVYRSAPDGPYLLEISDFIVSEHLVSNMTELTYTFESWQANMAQLRQQFPDKRVVGWYHTHVVAMLLDAIEQTASPKSDPNEAEIVLSGTTMFFSQHDVFLHTQFFPDPWYVALVLDPWGNCLFFQWKGGKITPCAAYHVYDDVGVA